MNRKLIALICALSGAACGGSDSRPPQDPATANTTAEPSRPMVVANATTDSSNPGTRAGADAPPTTAPPTTSAAETAGTTRGGDRASSANRQGDPSSNAAAPVVANPGSMDQTKDADNTKINARDRHDALTPMDQSNSSADTKITATLRRGIMGDKTLSFTAKNVKVITVGNKVTLRGPVKSDQEKATIEALARQTAGVSEVDDQLEVKK